MSRLSGKIAIITGASQGMGMAHARAFVAHGAKVILGDLNEKAGKALASPHRLELLEVLAQCERTVEALAHETGLSVANASQHLQVLRAARLVDFKAAASILAALNPEVG